MGTIRQARLYRGTAHNLRRLSAALQRGELVAVPSETVYGLAGHALDPAACRAIFDAKGRPTNDPLIVHVYEWAQVESLAVPNEAAQKLAERFWPGPLTLVLPKRSIVDPIVTSGLPSVALRMPSHPLLRRLLKTSRLPLAAPSANPFGYISPTTAEHVRASLGDKIRHILNGGPCPIGLESTIVDLRDPNKPMILRPGAISREEVSRTLDRPVRQRSASNTPGNDPTKAAVAPGLLSRHYSPRTRTILHKAIRPSEWLRSSPEEAWLLQSRPTAHRLPPNIFWLDPKGNLRGAARRLFATLREIDHRGFACIHVEAARGEALAEAINDRLRRAASKS